MESRVTKITNDSANLKRSANYVTKPKSRIEQALENLMQGHFNPLVIELQRQDEELMLPLMKKLKNLSDDIETKYVAYQKFINQSIRDDDLPISKMLYNLTDKLDKNQAKNMDDMKAQIGEKIEKRNSEIKLRELLRQDIEKCQIELKSVHENISNIQKKYEDRNEFLKLFGEEFVTFGNLSSEINVTYEKYKTGVIKENDVQACSKVLYNIAHLAKEIDSKKEQISTENKKSEKINDLQMDVVKIEKNNETHVPEDGDGNSICIESYKYYLNLKNTLLENESIYQPILNDKYKPLRFQCKKALNSPVNELSSLDGRHILDKYNRIMSALNSELTSGARTEFPELSEDAIRCYGLDLLARKFISHGELAISSKPEAAYPIASVIIAIWIQFPKFGTLFLAHIMSACPYIIPAYYYQKEGESDDEHYRSLGYQSNSKGQFEKHHHFLKRMSGLMRLYAAITVTPARHGQPHPHGISFAWRWLAATINLDPYPDISSVLIYEFLDVTHYFLSLHYGSQFSKIIYLLCSEYIPKVNKVTLKDCQGPVVRLKSFLERIIKVENPKPPSGTLVANFW